MAVVPYVRATHSDGQSWSAAKANLLEAGCNDLSYAPAVRVYHNANQAVTTATWTTLAFNTERFDQAGNAADTMHDTVTNNSRLTCRYAGIYQITGHFNFAASASGLGRFIRIRLNGATIISGELGQSFNATYETRLGVSTLYALAVNDYVELQAFQDTGGSINVLVGANYSPEFMMVRVA